MKHLYCNIIGGLVLSLFLVSTAQGQISKRPFPQKIRKNQKSIPKTSKQQLFQKWGMQTFAPPAASAPKALLGPSPVSSTQRSVADIRKVSRDPQTGMPIMIRSTSQLAARARLTSRQAATDFYKSYLGKMQDVIPLKDVNQEFDLQSFHIDKLGHSHIKLQQVFKGLPVWGSEAMIHINSEGKELFNGRFTYTPQLADVNPRLSPEQAIAKVEQDIPNRFKRVNFSEKQLEIMQYAGPKVDLIIYANPMEPSAHWLAYQVEVRPNVKDHVFYMVDAKTGDILEALNHTCTFAPEDVYPALPPTNSNGQDLNGNNKNFSSFDVGNGFLLVDATKNMYRGNPNSLENNDGLIITYDHMNDVETDGIAVVSSANNQWSPTSVSAHANASVCYDYFESTFQHTSIDDKGRDINSFINVPDEENQPMDNAYWNGIGIYYGNGDRAFSALAGALDVAAHEITHGVISATANLVYQDEPGALNESFADVFGILVENEDFLIGEEVVNPQFFPSGALRDAGNPNQGGNSLNDPGYQPANVSQQFRGPEDNGGVHINSGIPNLAFALFLTNDAVGKQKAEQVYYRALTEYLLRSSQFVDARLAVVQAAEDLYGPEEVAAANLAFDQVGILGPDQGGEAPTDPFDELEINPGRDLIVLVNTASADEDPNRLYFYDPNATQNSDLFTPISTSEPFSPVSISDDGRTMVWIDDGHRMKAITGLDTEDQAEFFVDTTAFWDNVALSKDGLRLAAVSMDIDTSIYVFDLVSGRGGRYQLFNPTTAQGVIAGNVLFADAMEWSFDGELLMYDAFNEVSEGDEFSESFWDIGFLRAWDSESDDFGDGNIFKLITNLDEGTSIGNPVFSKNSPFIIAFDELVENDPESFEDDQYFIQTVNVETGDRVRAIENTTIGYPTYSVDDRQIAFTTEDENLLENIAILPLQEDKITPSGNATVPVREAKWPVWFGTGERSLSVDVDEELTNGTPLQLYPNPAGDQLSISYELARQVDMELNLYNSLGQQIRKLNRDADALPGRHVLEVELSSIPAGVYLIVWKVEGKQEVVRFVKN